MGIKIQGGLADFVAAAINGVLEDRKPWDADDHSMWDKLQAEGLVDKDGTLLSGLYIEAIRYNVLQVWATFVVDRGCPAFALTSASTRGRSTATLPVLTEAVALGLSHGWLVVKLYRGADYRVVTP